MPKRIDIDLYVGRRIRMRRNVLRLSQAAIGKRVGVTFQQIQKYEKGESRVGGHRLQAIAAALKVPIGFFFDAGPGGERVPKRVTSNFIDEFLADPCGIELARYFVNIDRPSRDTVLTIAEAFAAKTKMRDE